MKRGIVYATKLEAEEANDRLARSIGYPIAGLDIGGGVHAPPEQSATKRPYDVIECADGTFLVPTDAEIEEKLDAAELSQIVVAKEKPAPVAPTTKKP